PQPGLHGTALQHHHGSGSADRGADHDHHRFPDPPADGRRQGLTMTLAVAFGIVLAAGALLVLVSAVTLPVRQRRASIERAVRAGGDAPVEVTDPAVRERLFQPFLQTLGQLVLRLSPKGTAERTEKRLVAAWLRDRISPAAFIGGR